MKFFSSSNLEKINGRDIQVTLVEKISSETGKKVFLDDLDNNMKYRFRIKRDKGFIYYFFLGFSKESLKIEIPALNLLGLSGEYFVSPKGGKL